MFDLEAFLAGVRRTVDAELERLLPAPDADDPGRLQEAMRYAVLGGGKRLRPAVVLGACVAAGGSERQGLPAAAAVEMLHAYTLVHDDLPAMDDDDERRGRPTVHIAFGEANAILAGDALLTSAFGTLAALGPHAGAAVQVLADRAGARWLLAGQARDIAVAGDARALELAELEIIHAGKTGALFAASAELGAIAAGGGADVRARLAAYGMALGIAFQHADDLADGDHPSHKDAAMRRTWELIAEAHEALVPFGERGGALGAIAEWVVKSIT